MRRFSSPWRWLCLTRLLIDCQESRNNIFGNLLFWVVFCYSMSIVELFSPRLSSLGNTFEQQITFCYGIARDPFRRFRWVMILIWLLRGFGKFRSALFWYHIVLFSRPSAESGLWRRNGIFFPYWDGAQHFSMDWWRNGMLVDSAERWHMQMFVQRETAVSPYMSPFMTETILMDYHFVTTFHRRPGKGWDVTHIVKTGMREDWSNVE